MSNNRKGYGRLWEEKNPERSIYLIAKKRARLKGIEFSIGVEDIIIPEFCPVLGIPLYRGTGKACHNSPALDRIDNSKGYIKGNVGVISHRANRWKADMSKSDCQKILDYFRKFDL